MSKNVRLKYRILLGYSIPLSLSIIVAVLVFFSITKVEHRLKEVETSHGILDDIKDLSFSVTTMQRASRGYLLMKNEASLKAYEDGEKYFNELTQSLVNQVTDAKQQERLREITKLGKQVNETSKNEISLVNEGKPDAAIALFKSGEGIKLAREMEAAGKEFEKGEREIVQKKQTAENTAISFLLGVLIIGTSLSVVIAVASGLWVSGRISKRIAEATSAISASSVEIASTVEQHERTAVQQSASVSETSTAMEELGASSRQVSEQAESATATVQKGLSLVEKGTNTVEQTLSGMVVTKDKARIISEQILHLSEQTGQIGSIAMLVNDIANQVNLLALNASVEAARAGEHGRGFSVVAVEIRKLADQAKKSLERVNALVTDIQKATNSAVMAAEEGTKTIDEDAQLAKSVAGVFSDIVTSMKAIHENAQQVMLNAKQQSAGISQVVTAINAISAGAKETAAGISQTKVGIEKLKEAAVSLKEIV